ncbi:MAG: multicopper oxidase domain-containing protein [Longimicrobiales bacterium]
MTDRNDKSITRRTLLRRGALGTAAVAAASAGIARAVAGSAPESTVTPLMSSHDAHSPHALDVVGDIKPGGLDPDAFLTHFEYGREAASADGRRVREYEIVATNREIEIAPGLYFPAWTYNGSVPGPTIRCTEGDRVRVRFVNGGTHPHTMHFHGVHPANMDGAMEIVQPGSAFVYEFDAEPFGVHLYHCHVPPFKRHIHKGLYGMFIIDPPTPREPAREMVMMMNGFDTNLDNDNEVYAVNSVAFHYQKHPIQIDQGELVRIYLGNMTEFDLLNSFHLHGNIFKYYRTGTTLTQYESTDTVALCQGERGVVEFRYKHTGQFMFHAHQSEFAELGWSGAFNVRPVVHA